MLRHCRWLLVLGSVLAGVGVCGSADEAAPRRYRTTIPFQLSQGDGMPLVAVKVDRLHTLTMVLDTGTGIHYLAESAAARLGLTPRALYVHNNMISVEPVGEPYVLPHETKPARGVITPRVHLGWETGIRQQPSTFKRVK